MKVRKRVTARKAAETFLKYAVVVGGALSTVEIPEGTLTDKALLTLGISTLAAVVRAVNNVRKTRKAAPHPASYVNYKNLTLFAVALSLGLAGCVTTTAPDGSTVVSVDAATLDTAWRIYQATLDRKEELKAEREAAAAADRARLDRELQALEPELQAAWLRAMGLADK